MAEGAPLLREYTLIGIEGSNPSLSANFTTNPFSELGISMHQPPVIAAIPPHQAYRGVFLLSRHEPALALSIADLLCDCHLQAYLPVLLVRFNNALKSRC